MGTNVRRHRDGDNNNRGDPVLHGDDDALGELDGRRGRRGQSRKLRRLGLWSSLLGQLPDREPTVGVQSWVKLALLDLGRTRRPARVAGTLGAGALLFTQVVAVMVVVVGGPRRQRPSDR